MRNVLGSSSIAVCRKDARNKIFLLGYPKFNHRFRSKRAWGATPDILALKWTTWSVRGVLEFSCFRKMVCPILRTLRQVRAPTQRRNTHAGAFAVMAVEEPIIEIAQPWLSSSKQRHRDSKKSEFPRRFVEPLHNKSPRCLGKLACKALRASGLTRLKRD